MPVAAWQHARASDTSKAPVSPTTAGVRPAVSESEAQGGHSFH